MLPVSQSSVIEGLLSYGEWREKYQWSGGRQGGRRPPGAFLSSRVSSRIKSSSKDTKHQLLGPVYNRPSTDYLHHFVKNKNRNKITKIHDTWHLTPTHLMTNWTRPRQSVPISWIKIWKLSWHFLVGRFLRFFRRHFLVLSGLHFWLLSGWLFIVLSC